MYRDKSVHRLYSEWIQSIKGVFHHVYTALNVMKLTLVRYLESRRNKCMYRDLDIQEFR